jgi:hypothetical protein
MSEEPYEFAQLATYNAEVARGIVHTPEWKAKMAHEQERFDWQTRREFLMRNQISVEHLGPPPPPVYLPPAQEKIGIEWHWDWHTARDTFFMALIAVIIVVLAKLGVLT